MGSYKIIAIPLTVILCSCYFFPFVLAAFPIANSKMIMAAVGLGLFIIELARKQNAGFDRDFVNLTVLALCVSLIAFASSTINHTQDNTFSLYVVSMWVWLGGAYTMTRAIKLVHGEIGVPLVVNYLLAVCAAQCVMALIFDNSPEASLWSGRTFAGEGYMGNVEDDRLHGIGCSLDVAGFRFAAVICMSAYILYWLADKVSIKTMLMYVMALCFITVVGNMISRSTVIGSAMAFIFLLAAGMFSNGRGKIFGIVSVMMILAIMICVFLYNINDSFRANIRFGFEGFFSIAETGEWKTNSNDILKNMVVWPDNAHTWLIGDGYLENPLDKGLPSFDPYYVGKSYGGYYKGTDIGYLRYIFYFGLIGLITFSLYFISACRMLCRRYINFRWMFILLLVVNFIEWFKVSTDLFVVFAPFFCLTSAENEEYLLKRIKDQ